MSKKIRAFCIRGLGYVPSDGMETLTKLLNMIEGVSATDQASGIVAFENVTNLTNACVAAYADGRGRDLVLCGHSFGGNAVNMIAANLQKLGIPVALACPIDPAMQSNITVPLNVAKVLSWYQKVDPVGRGIVHGPGIMHNGSQYLAVGPGEGLEHWQRRALVKRKDQAHVRIDNDPSIHAEIAQAVRALRSSA